MSQKGFLGALTLRCIFGFALAPLAVSLLIAPRLFDYCFPDIAAGFKALILIVTLLFLLWVMLDSSKTAIYVSVWIVIVAVFVVAFEIDRILPDSHPIHQTHEPVIAFAPTPIPIPIKSNTQSKIVKKEADTLQFSTFNAREKTPIPTPTATPNLTPFFDFSSLTAKDQSIGSLPSSAFFGGHGSSSFGGGVINFFKKIYQSVFGR